MLFLQFFPYFPIFFQKKISGMSTSHKIMKSTELFVLTSCVHFLQSTREKKNIVLEMNFAGGSVMPW